MRESVKLQITVDESVSKIINREAAKRKARPMTYAAMIFSECVIKREEMGW